MTPLERAARAVREEMNDYPTEGGWMGEGGVRDEGFYRDIVRAVLTAIREPGEEVLAAGSEEARSMTYNYHMADEVSASDSDVARNVYTAMIDAALAEEG